MAEITLTCKRCSDTRPGDEFILCNQYGKPICPPCNRLLNGIIKFKKKLPPPFPKRLTDED